MFKLIFVGRLELKYLMMGEWKGGKMSVNVQLISKTYLQQSNLSQIYLQWISRRSSGWLTRGCKKMEAADSVTI